MGSLGDGIEQGDARRREIKTAPLWGLRARSRFLHDGRAAIVAEAILGHAGEARVARERFARLDADAQQQLLEFLATIQHARKDRRCRSSERAGACHTSCYIGPKLLESADQETAMSAYREERTYQESRIEDEPILGAVLVLPSGRIQPLTLWERVLARLHLTSAKALEARYFKAANS